MNKKNNEYDNWYYNKSGDIILEKDGIEAMKLINPTPNQITGFWEGAEVLPISFEVKEIG